MKLGILFLIAALVVASAVAAEPKRVKLAEFERMVQHFPKDIGFGYSGAAFFEKRLYVSCNLGLVVVSDGGKIELLQWRSNDAVIEGPWLDRANGTLWAQQANDGSLVKFDGKRWEVVALPTPAEGYFTRGDVLSGFRGISSAESFWMEGGNSVWKWNPEKANWNLERNPPMPEGGHIRAFLPYRDKLIYYTRVGDEWDFGDNNRKRATIHTWRGQWHEVAAADLSVEEYVISDEGAYIRTKGGAVFDLSGDKAIQVECPGPCEAIGRTSTGGLLASFVRHGVFLRVGDSWSLKAKTPYAPGEGEHRAHLTEDGGRIVLVTAPVPHLVGSSDTFENSGTAGIWMSDGGDFKPLQIGK